MIGVETGVVRGYHNSMPRKKEPKIKKRKRKWLERGYEDELEEFDDPLSHYRDSNDLGEVFKVLDKGAGSD